MTAGWHDEDAPRIEPAAGGPADGSYAAIAPDPERDARRDAYRERERRRAARALDRYFETLMGDTVAVGPAVSVAGDRFVEAVGDYVLARLSEGAVWPRAHAVWARAHTMGLHESMWVEKCPLCLPSDDPRQSQHKRHYGAASMDTGILPNAHRCADCSFTTADGDRMDGHLRATGHRHEGDHHNAGHYGVADCTCVPVPDPVTEEPIHSYSCDVVVVGTPPQMNPLPVVCSCKFDPDACGVHRSPDAS